MFEDQEPMDDDYKIGLIGGIFMGALLLLLALTACKLIEVRHAVRLASGELDSYMAGR